MDREIAFLDAVRADNRQAMQSLLEEQPGLVSACATDGVSALRLAAYHGHPETATWLRSRGASADLFDAAALGDTDCIEELMRRGCDVNAPAGDGWTPLHLSAFFNRPEAAKRLLAAGADPRRIAANDHGNTPLHSAVAGHAPAVARILLEGGADPNAREPGGLTPLHLAAMEGTLETVLLLVNSGADADLRDAEGNRPIDHARKRGEDDITRVLGA